jgi:23S rRNA (guanine745-N1)-methyltransferase
MSLYKCPVCSLALLKQEKVYKCNNNHSYDIAKKGHVNLILANQGRSLNEGDSKEMIESRKKFLNCGFYSILRFKLFSLIQDLFINKSKINFLDVACGEGYYTNYLHSALNNSIPINTYGVDISKSAIISCQSNANANGLHDISYCIGNLDYIPFLNNSFNLLLNCFAPINAIEFNRVLEKDGYFIRVLPGMYHLYELKEFLYSEIHLNQPKEDEIPGFSLENQYQVDDIITLNNEQIQNLFTMTPYYYKTGYEAKERLKKLEILTTKISFIIKVYRKK